jgi:hypothetical protein
MQNGKANAAKMHFIRGRAEEVYERSCTRPPARILDHEKGPLKTLRLSGLVRECPAYDSLRSRMLCASVIPPPGRTLDVLPALTCAKRIE